MSPGGPRHAAAQPSSCPSGASHTRMSRYSTCRPSRSRSRSRSRRNAFATTRATRCRRFTPRSDASDSSGSGRWRGSPRDVRRGARRYASHRRADAAGVLPGVRRGRRPEVRTDRHLALGPPGPSGLRPGGGARVGLPPGVETRRRARPRRRRRGDRHPRRCEPPGRHRQAGRHGRIGSGTGCTSAGAAASGGSTASRR
jgi:hypothetical protein